MRVNPGLKLLSTYWLTHRTGSHYNDWNPKVNILEILLDLAKWYVTFTLLYSSPN